MLARIPVRLNKDDRYFSDQHQALPTDGYTFIFESMLPKNPKITIRTGVDYFKVNKGSLRDFLAPLSVQVQDELPTCGLLVFTGPIDAYFASLGWPKLEYRSLRWEIAYHDVEEGQAYQEALQINYPGPEVDYTRIVEYKHKPNQPIGVRESAGTAIFKEYSVDGGDPYYPVPNPDNRALYEKYKKMADSEPGVVFVGRLASYKYFNMDQAVLNALEAFDDLQAKGDAPFDKRF